MKSYTTTQGDTFESIAWFQLGDSTKMWDLMEANRKEFETAVFPAGVELTIPDVKTAVTADLTPPWRRTT